MVQEDIFPYLSSTRHLCASADAEESYLHRGELFHGCLVNGMKSCSEYKCLGLPPMWTDASGQLHAFGNHAMCSDTPCKTSTPLRVVYAHNLTWYRCAIDALTTITSLEMVTTGLVLMIYMCQRHGPCWCSNSTLLGEVAKVAGEGVSTQELARLHSETLPSESA